VASPRSSRRAVAQGPTPHSGKLEPTGNLDEMPPVLDRMQPDIAYLAKIVAAS
jgi:hypothetical protein